MLVLIDSNVLLRAANVEDPSYATAIEALARLDSKDHQPALVPQCCYEYYVVATRPTDRNGLGLEPSAAIRDIADYLGIFRVLRDERAIFEGWEELMTKYQVRGKAAHDARLVAAMLRHGITHLLTFNGSDFRRYIDRITILDPREVAAGVAPS
jgi:predicted nucleic acid-binding protein